MRLDPDIIDAGKRASDTVNELITHHGWSNLSRKCIAFRLADGSYDGTLYDGKQAAVRHQRDQYKCAYFFFRNCAGGTTPRDMAIYLQFNRDAYTAGFRMPDPDDIGGGPDLLMTAKQGAHYRERYEDTQAHNVLTALPPNMRAELDKFLASLA